MQYKRTLILVYSRLNMNIRMKTTSESKFSHVQKLRKGSWRENLGKLFISSWSIMNQKYWELFATWPWKNVIYFIISAQNFSRGLKFMSRIIHRRECGFWLFILFSLNVFIYFFYCLKKSEFFDGFLTGSLQNSSLNWMGGGRWRWSSA